MKIKTLSMVAVALCLGLYGWTVWYDRSLKNSDPFGHRHADDLTAGGRLKNQH